MSTLRCISSHFPQIHVHSPTSACDGQPCSNNTCPWVYCNKACKIEVVQAEQVHVEIPHHALPSAHLTDFAGFAGRGVFCLSCRTGGTGVVRTSPSPHLRLLRRRQTIPLAHPKRQPALSSQRALALCPSWSYSVGTVRTVAYRVCCEAGAVVYRTRPHQSRERGRSWMLKGGDTASISAVEIVMVSASDLGGGKRMGPYLPSPAVVFLEVVSEV